MRPTIRFAAILSALVAFSPSSVLASPILLGDPQSWSYDGTADGCSTCQADVVFELLSATSLKISFENTSTDGLAGVNILTGIGFDTAEALSEISILSQEIEGGKVWKLGGGLGAGNWEIALGSKNGINHGLDAQSDLFDSGWVILGWSSPVLSLEGLTIENSLVKFQAAGQTGGGVHAVGTQFGSSPITVPEPSSLLLFAASVGIVARRYRRQSGSC